MFYYLVELQNQKEFLQWIIALLYLGQLDLFLSD